MYKEAVEDEDQNVDLIASKDWSVHLPGNTQGRCAEELRQN